MYYAYTCDPTGVSYRGGNFYTKIKLDGQTKTFGPYRTDVEAARAYDSVSTWMYSESLALIHSHNLTVLRVRFKN